MEIKINSLQDIRCAAKTFLENKPDKNLIAFYGSMGAGKTTFIKALCDEMGVNDVVNSPTFAIVNEYTAGNGEPVYHFDFYRLKNKNEAFDFGYETYMYSGNLCLMEWPEIIEDLLDEDCLKVTLTAAQDGSRILSF